MEVWRDYKVSTVTSWLQHIDSQLDKYLKLDHKGSNTFLPGSSWMPVLP